MKKDQTVRRRGLSAFLALLLCLSLLPGAALAADSDVAIDPASFPDENFRSYISENIDENKDGALSAGEIAAVKTISCADKDISNLTGIEYFTALTELQCDNNDLTTLDVSKNTALTKLQCYYNQLTSLDVSKNTALTELQCNNNQLTSLDVSANTSLTSLRCSGNQLTTLTLNTALTYLNCSSNRLAALDVSRNPGLNTLYCADNDLTTLDVSANAALTLLSCGGNQLTGLDVSKNTALESLICGSNRFTSLDLSKNTTLKRLDCSNNQLTNLDLSKTQVTLDKLNCTGNQYTLNLAEGVNTYDLTQLPKEFDVTRVSNVRGAEITGTTLKVAQNREIVLYKYDCGNNILADFMLKVHAGTVRRIELTKQGTYTFPPLTVGYATVTSNNFLIRNTGNVPTGPLKVVVEGENASAFRIRGQDVTIKPDGSIPSIGLLGTAPGIEYKPVLGLAAGTYKATVTVKSADDNGAAVSASFDISVTVNPGAPPAHGFTLSQTGSYTFPGLTYGYADVAPLAVTVTNTGTQETGALTVTLSNSTAFAVTKSSISSIPAGGTAVFQVQPAAGLSVGRYSGTVTVTGSGNVHQSFSVSLEVKAAGKVAAPVIRPGGGSFTGTQTVTITCATQGAYIAYTTDGSEVSASSTPYTGPITLTETTIKAQATMANMDSSDTVTAVFTRTSGGGSSGSGGSSSSGSSVSVDRVKNGTITVSPKSAGKGSTVTVTVTPDEGYELDTIQVLDKDGKELKLTDKGSGKYTFTMPAGKVEVKAGFVEKTPEQIFADVPADAGCYEAVKWAADKGITGGVGNGLFAPDRPCTRAQIVTFLWRAAGSPEPGTTSGFADVAADAYCAKAAAWAAENGITAGTGGGKFSPDAVCTRAQAVTFLYRASGAPAVSGNAAFGDVAANAYYAAAVKWAADKGVTDGVGNGLFAPDQSCTRAQIVTFLYRIHQGK